MDFLWLVGAVTVACVCLHAIATVVSHVCVDSVEGRVVLVTGCDRGLGKEMCVHLGGKGVKVVEGTTAESSQLSEQGASDFSSLPTRKDHPSWSVVMLGRHG